MGAELSWIPVMLFEAASINGPYATVDAIDGYFRGCQLNYGTMFLVSCMDSSVVSHPVAVPEHPKRGYR